MRKLCSITRIQIERGAVFLYLQNINNTQSGFRSTNGWSQGNMAVVVVIEGRWMLQIRVQNITV